METKCHEIEATKEWGKCHPPIAQTSRRKGVEYTVRILYFFIITLTATTKQSFVRPRIVQATILQGMHQGIRTGPLFNASQRNDGGRPVYQHQPHPEIPPTHSNTVTPKHWFIPQNPPIFKNYTVPRFVSTLFRLTKTGSVDQNISKRTTLCGQSSCLKILASRVRVCFVRSIIRDGRVPFE